MANQFIPYGRQHITQTDIDAVVAVLQSDFLTQGSQVPAFEERVATYTGAKFGVAVNSATSALHIACLALGLGQGEKGKDDWLWTTPITFTASVFAYGKLAAKKWAKTISGAWVKPVQALIFLAMLGFGIHFFLSGNMTSFWAMTGLALAFGWVWIAPVGGGDMPVVVSLLNSFSGWAAAGIGFTLENNMLIVAGSLVGSSGAILSYIMCKAMNRSIINVLFGGAMGGAAAPTAAAGAQVQRNYRSGSADDAGFLMSNADSVVIVPGYGMAQGRAQNAVKELANLLKEQGVTVRFAIHPVAGRMPGHMNVLLAEADVPYEDILEMDEINSDFPATDVVLVIGANDVVNPAAKDDPNSPIYGMPILEAHKARTIMVIKRSMATGYAGLDNDLFYNDKTMMIFGDAKKVVEDMTKAINGTGH